MSNQRSNFCDGKVSALVCSNLTVCSTSSRPTNVCDCPCSANVSNKCRLCLAVLEPGLGVHRKAEPLKLALEDNNLHAVCMMIYYGINFEVPNWYPYGPLEYAVEYNHVEIAKVLIHFYDDLNFRNNDENKFRELVDCGGSDPTLFKLLLSRIDPNVYQFDLVLHYFLRYESKCCRWSTADWLECLYLILANVIHPRPRFFWSSLFDRFRQKDVQQEDRLKLIYILHSFGYHILLSDFDCICKLYGFGDELEAFIYSSNCNTSISSYYLSAPFLPLTAIPDKSRFIYKDFQRNFEWYSDNYVKLDTVGRYQQKGIRELPPDIAKFKEEMANKVKHILSEFPSLLELSRNQVRATIFNLVRYPYQFHDRVKQLKLPCILEDMVRLKTNVV